MPSHAGGLFLSEGKDVKLQGPIDLQKVIAFRGVVDIYYSKGQPVARQWPRTPKQPNTPQQIETRNRMTAAVKWAQEQPLSWAEAWKQSNQTPGRSYRDRYLSEAIRMQAYATLKRVPDVVKTELKPADGVNPSHLKITLQNGAETPTADWYVAVRAQPPGDPALTYYDAGWYTERCIAVYKLYLPIQAGFKLYEPQPGEAAPDEWIVPTYSTPDAVSWFPVTRQAADANPETLPMLLPPQIAK